MLIAAMIRVGAEARGGYRTSMVGSIDGVHVSERDLSTLGIVVVNYGPPDLLADGLATVSKEIPEAHILVVDNFSTSEARAAVVDLCGWKGWTVLTPDTNTGFGVACNLGAEAALVAGCRRLLFLNPDATIDRASVLRLREAVDDDPYVLAAPIVTSPEGDISSSYIDLDLDTGDMRSGAAHADNHDDAVFTWVSGACFLLSAELWRRVGGFQGDYFLYWEDVDLCARVVTTGGRVAVIDDAIAVHAEGGTQRDPGARMKSSIYYYYNVRNRALFAAVWLGDKRQRRWRQRAVRSAYQILLRGGRRQFLQTSAPLRAGVRGLRDGRRVARAAERAPVKLG